MKIIGIGNALLDVLLRLDGDHVLSEMGIRKGAMELIDEAAMRALQQAQAGRQRSEAPGGSVCNTIRAMARLGAEVGYIGKTGDDHAGRVYEAMTRAAGVDAFFVRAQGISGCSTVLVSPDGERTMATFLGPAATLSDEEIPEDLLRRYDGIFMEGYLISNEKLFLPVLKRAKRLGLKVALTLSNFNIVNAFRDLLKEVIPAYVDILIANESEAEAYAGQTVHEAVGIIAEEVATVAVTIGREGVLAAADGGTVIREAALDCRVVDTTGAGDNFAAGFLYGHSVGATLRQSVKTGTLLAANVIETVGAQIPEARWEQITLNADGILKG